METRICGLCNAEKELVEFHQNKSNPLGRAYWCKVCRNAFDRERNKRNGRKLQIQAWTDRPSIVGQRKGKQSWYIRVVQANHPRADARGQVRRSVLVVEGALKRYLVPDEEVHHINGIRTDDSLENLEVVTHSEHRRLENNFMAKLRAQV